MLARVTVEDCFCSTMEKINNKALGLQIRSEELDLSFRLSLLSWSDNIFTIGPKFEEVAELTKILEGELWDLHRLHLKQEREILAASTYTFKLLREDGRFWIHLEYCFRSQGTWTHSYIQWVMQLGRQKGLNPN